MLPWMRRQNKPSPGSALHYDFTRDPFCDTVLDLSGRNSAFPNLLTNPEFVDSNNDGIADSWNLWKPATTTTVTVIEDGYTKMKLLSTTSAITTTVSSFHQAIPFTAGNKYLLKAVCKVVGANATIRGQAQLEYKNSAGTQLGATVVRFTNTEDTEISVLGEAIPVGTVNIHATFAINTLVTDGSARGEIWIKSPSVTFYSDFKLPDKRCMLHGPKWTPEGLYFDGIDDYCVIENNADADIISVSKTQPLAIGIVFKIDPTKTTSGYLISKSAGVYNDAQYSIYYDTNDPRGILTTYLNGGVANLSFAITKGVFHFVLLTNDGTNTKIYFDGILGRSSPRSLTTLISRPYLRIGCRSSSDVSNSMFFKGIISELFIYQQEAQDIINWFYNTGRPLKYGITM